MKKIIITIVILACVAGVIFWGATSKENQETPQENILTSQVVEQYIRDNIATLAPEEPVLGGSWYIISLDLDEQTQTGTMTYEDGHIMGSATFSYGAENGGVVIRDIEKIQENQ
jgi:hypothetical protein